MRWIHAVAAAVAATGLATSVAKATLTVSLVPIPITAAAKTADPTLSNARAFDLRVTQTGERWNVTTMQLNLANSGNLSGSFYQSPAPLISHNGHVLQTSFNNTTPQFYDTSVNVSMNDSARTIVLGDSDFPANSATGTLATQTATKLSIAYGDVAGDSNTTATTGGSFSIGHITVLGNTGSYFSGYVAGNVNLNQKQAFTNVYLPILGDTDGDGLVGFTDFVNVKNNFNGTGPGDTNGDGAIDFNDFVNVKNNFNNSLTPPPGAALGSLVPEPASLATLALAGAFGFTRRRRTI